MRILKTSKTETLRHEGSPADPDTVESGSIRRDEFQIAEEEWKDDGSFESD
ncbi:hypothetical protein [Erythrobacter alti]|uniref:hypothetical protein n=1 Tax=Erythrobacter alti TaxID=1896145 RepID=UPI0030F3CA21